MYNLESFTFQTQGKLHRCLCKFQAAKIFMLIHIFYSIPTYSLRVTFRGKTQAQWLGL